jgi:uncharacterized protein involved in response to NO
MTDRTAAAAANGRQRPPRHAAETLFFPAAALYAALAVPLSVHGMLSGQPVLPGFAGVAGHAHELLFGFSLAVVAGFLINKVSAYRLSALFSLWLIARAAYLIHPGSLSALIANAGLAVMLLWLAVPQFVRGAKKWRNKAIAPILLALAGALILFHLPRLMDAPWLRFVALEQGVVVLALLMLFMGGRIIAPAVAGAIERAGGRLEARVQPRLEAALLIVMAALFLALAVPGGRPVAGLMAAIASGLALARLLRWRLWAAPRRPDLWCLGIGMGWLVVGLALLAIAWITNRLPVSATTHAITVGALGTLTTGVMARVRLNRIKHNPAQSRIIPLMTGLIAVAAILRLTAPTDVYGLVAASACWAGAYVLLLWLIIKTNRTQRQPAA